MNNETILKQAIEKAVHNGYEPEERETQNVTVSHYYDSKEWYADIFSHDFAKAFWKDEPRKMYLVKTEDVGIGSVTVDGGEAWKAHLQQMVLEEEPLKYLEKFL